MIIAKSARKGATTPTDGTAHRRTIEAGNRLLIALDDERKNRVSISTSLPLKAHLNGTRGGGSDIPSLHPRSGVVVPSALGYLQRPESRPVKNPCRFSGSTMRQESRPDSDGHDDRDSHDIVVGRRVRRFSRELNATTEFRELVVLRLSRGIPEVNTPQESREVLPLGMVSIEVAEETLWLLPERAAFWPARGMLFVADAHIGKAAAFRSAGIAIPAGTTASDLDCLSRLIEQLGARRIAFLGDLLHSRQGRQPRTLESFHAWRERHAEIEMLLIRGNHDRRAGDPPAEWGIVCTDPPLVVGAFALCHDPQPVAGHYSLAGHVHPAVCMTGRGRERTRLPCFLLRADYAILPAFGGLTGMFTVTPEIGDRVYVVAGDTVVPAR